MKLACVLKKEGKLWSSLCIELDVASCGETQKEAIEGLKRAIESYIEHKLAEGREAEILRPVPPDALREFLIGEEKEERLRPFNALPLEVTCG